MQIPENPNNNDIREALIHLGIELNQIRDEFDQKIEELNNKIERSKIKKSNYNKSDVYRNGTDGMVRLSITVIITTASVVVLSSLSPAVTAIITALSSANAG